MRPAFLPTLPPTLALKRRSESGQTATEYMLLVSVIVVAVVAASYTFVPTFRQGVASLAEDVSTILDTGKIGGAGVDRSGGGMDTGTTNSAGVTSMSCEDPRWGAMYDPPPCL